MDVARQTDRLMLRLIAFPRGLRKAMVFAFDLLLCVLAAWIAYWLRMGDWVFISRPVAIFTAIALAIWIGLSTTTRTYRSVVRFSGRKSIFDLLGLCAILSLILAAILLAARFDGVPRTLAVIHPLVFFLALSTQRLALARLILGALHAGRRNMPPKRVLIYGAGWAGQQLSLSVRHDMTMRVIGFVDENEALRDHRLDGRPIWHADRLEAVLAMEEVGEVFLAIPSAPRATRRSIVERIRKSNPDVQVRVLPTLAQIASGRVSVSDLRHVEIEELLGRDEVPADPDLISRNIAGRRVLVTGAGGSIGSELCRQIVRQRPLQLILADHSEHALYLVDTALREMMAKEAITLAIDSRLVNVADREECRRLFLSVRPDTVFHAAAYKHVPLLEANALAGVRNNVLGTLHACRSAEEAGTRNFILVSTDKAVRPTNVMGASKRICELIVQARAEAQSDTRYTNVRFGNVLGSSGSVIPRFRDQIAGGGPVTLTHRDATRFFMTIPEAAQLVIQASALAEDGEVLLLDMGKPVRISDLARTMITLSGLTVRDDANPDGDIRIVETGLRPGEKLVEELLIGENPQATAHPRIIKARESMVEWPRLDLELGRLAAALAAGDSDAMLAVVMRLVPGFVPGRGDDGPVGDGLAPTILPTAAAG